MNTQIYKCHDCTWEGTNVEYDITETCFGEDKVEVCPECGSMNITPVFPAYNQ